MKITGSLLGSCRHQSIFSHYFPPRLYSLKEVEYFLYRLQIFKSFFDNHMYEDEIFKDCIDIMIGDACHKIVIEESKNFFAHTDSFFSNANFFIEVSTLTYCRKGNSIVSPFILDLRRDLFQREYFETIKMNEKDICTSLKNIHKSLEKITKRKVLLTILSHADLEISSDNKSRIPKRLELSNVLKQAVGELEMENIYFLDIWKNIRERGFTLADLFNDKHHLNEMGVQIASDTILLLTGSRHFPKQRYLNKIKQNLFGLN